MKAITCSLLLCFILLGSAVDAAEDWTGPLTPSPRPSARRSHDMAYLGGDQVLLFGGRDASGMDDETWVYDLGNNEWTDEEDGKTWISGIDKPSPRFHHAMAYIGGNQVLLFGGWDESLRSDETWVYDLGTNTWTGPLTPSPRPSDNKGRFRHAMAYIGGDQVLLHGGNDGSNRRDTWIYDLGDNEWTNKSPTLLSRTDHDMAYIGGGQVLLFGGGGFLNDTWIYDLDDNSWTEDSNTDGPSGRYWHALSQTSMDGSSYLVLFGGDDGTYYDDETWTFGGGDYPLPVALSSFTATAGDGQVTLRWVTESEIGNLGFYVYRALAEDGEYARLTSEVIEGAGTTTGRREYVFTSTRLTNGVTYWYKIEDVAFDGTTTMHGPICVTPQAEEAVEAEALPAKFGLLQCFPNPFNPTTEIRYQLPEASYVVLAVYDVLGQEVRVLVDGFEEAGSRSVVWDGKDEAGQLLGSGIYLYGMKANHQLIQMKKMALLR